MVKEALNQVGQIHFSRPPQDLRIDLVIAMGHSVAHASHEGEGQIGVVVREIFREVLNDCLQSDHRVAHRKLENTRLTCRSNESAVSALDNPLDLRLQFIERCDNLFNAKGFARHANSTA